MISRDYTKEVGLASVERRVSLPVALAIFALVAVAVTLFARQAGRAIPVGEGAAASLQVSHR